MADYVSDEQHNRDIARVHGRVKKVEECGASMETRIMGALGGIQGSLLSLDTCLRGSPDGSNEGLRTEVRENTKGVDTNTRVIAKQQKAITELRECIFPWKRMVVTFTSIAAILVGLVELIKKLT